MPDTTVRIREIAYRLWEDEGRPADRQLEHWARAERLADVLSPGDHGSTFAGGPVIAAAALAALALTSDERLLEDVRERGLRLAAGLQRLPHVLRTRGRGLMLACELDISAPEVVRQALLEQRLVVNATGPGTIRLLPPLIVGEPELDDAVGRLGAVLAA